MTLTGTRSKFCLLTPDSKPETILARRECYATAKAISTHCVLQSHFNPHTCAETGLFYQSEPVKNGEIPRVNSLIPLKGGPLLSAGSQVRVLLGSPSFQWVKGIIAGIERDKTETDNHRAITRKVFDSCAPDPVPSNRIVGLATTATRLRWSAARLTCR